MSRAQSVQVGSTDSAMRDLDIDIDVLEWLGLEFPPHQLTLGGTGIKAHPSFEFVIFCSHRTIGEDDDEPFSKAILMKNMTTEKDSRSEISSNVQLITNLHTHGSG